MWHVDARWLSRHSSPVRLRLLKRMGPFKSLSKISIDSHLSELSWRLKRVDKRANCPINGTDLTSVSCSISQDEDNKACRRNIRLRALFHFHNVVRCGLDLFDILWNTFQDGDIREVDFELDRIRAYQDSSDLDVQQLAAENTELKFRLALLVRLLISKGVISAHDYASLIASRSSDS
jgi:hypothetical protein